MAKIAVVYICVVTAEGRDGKMSVAAAVQHTLMMATVPLISQKQYKINAQFLLKSNKKSYALYQTVTLLMTLSDP